MNTLNLRATSARGLSSKRQLFLEKLESRNFMDGSGVITPALNDDSSIPAAISSPSSTTNPLFDFRIQITDLEGNPIDTIRVDDEFLVRIYIRDLRDLPPNSLHFFSAYTNLSLDPNHFVAMNRGQLGGDIWESASDIPTWNTETQSSSPIGGVVTSPYPNGDGHLLFQIQVRAIAEGKGKIETKPVPDQESSRYPTHFYGSNDPQPASSAYFESLALTVLAKEVVTPIEVLAPPVTTTTITPPSQLPVTNPAVVPLITEPRPIQFETNLPVTPISSVPIISVTEPPPIQSPIADGGTRVTSNIDTEASTDPSEEPIARTDSAIVLSTNTNQTSLVNSENRGSTAIVFVSVQREGISPKAIVLGSDTQKAELIETPTRSHRFAEAPSFTSLALIPVLTKTFSSSRDANGAIGIPMRPTLGGFENSRFDPRKSNTFVLSHANNMIDRMMQRLEMAPSLSDSPRHFVWEATYSRIALQRLPLHQSLPPFNPSESQKQKSERFMEVSMPSKDLRESRTFEWNESLTVHQATMTAQSSSAYQLTYPRAAMKPLALSKGNPQTLPIPQYPDLAAGLPFSIDPSEEEVEIGEADTDSSSTAWSWPSYILAGLTSIFLVVMKPSERHPQRTIKSQREV